MINVNPSKEFEMPEYLKENVAGSQEKDLRWLEPYEGKLCAVVRTKKYLAKLSEVQNKWPRGEQLTLTRKGRRTRACM
ncbi:hypothetical protein GOM44_02095 [Wolbachia endosymbiont of Atemnus politus]|uniref:hypothetical protein n=1 Tax=Wolbachia endosymbiont of Atemnus politus TaxID=2682840 RepID=UPI00157286D8|nr:hypothetical protein [Wolbachia endosymbiont of Atemnus politus]NSX83261.1 hypothetical protein [Wolbachia endosymbiont of Atemnus politus]